MIRDDEVREIAYRLWEQAGRPEGRDQEFWFTAEQEVQARERAGNGSAVGAASSGSQYGSQSQESSMNRPGMRRSTVRRPGR